MPSTMLVINRLISNLSSSFLDRTSPFIKLVPGKTFRAPSEVNSVTEITEPEPGGSLFEIIFWRDCIISDPIEIVSRPT